jgi:hypothetical protein
MLVPSKGNKKAVASTVAELMRTWMMEGTMYGRKVKTKQDAVAQATELTVASVLRGKAKGPKLSDLLQKGGKCDG